MRGRFRSLCTAVAVAMPLVLVSGNPATAAGADAMVVTGSGTISPGLTLVPVSQSISFAGTATVAGTHGVLATYSCSFSGTLIAGVAGGAGSISGSCGPISFDVCFAVAVIGSWSIVCQDGTRRSAQGWECEFSPSDTLPTTRYTLLCTGGHGSA